jgi:DNA polymerase-1
MIIQTLNQYDEAVSNIREAKIIAFDTETTWHSWPSEEMPWEDRELMGISCWLEIPGKHMEVGYYFPFRHEHDPELFPINNENLPLDWLKYGGLKEAIEESGNKIVWHNAKFDRQVLKREGINQSGFFYDTMLMSHLENENKFSHGLDSLGRNIGVQKLGTPIKSIAKSLKGWSKIPPEVMGMYAIVDAKITLYLQKKFQESLSKQELLELYNESELFSRVLGRIEERGIGIDLEVSRQLSQKALAQMQDALTQFGYDPQKPSQLAHRLFASQSEGLGLRPIGGYSKRKSVEFPQGLPIMDSKVLSRLNHEECERVLEYRSWMKANSTWYEGWFTRVASDGRLHPTYKQHGTVTSRLSCENPNMQQIPRDVEKSPVKTMLSARPGYQLWEFDYSQVEFRLGSVYADCEPILDTYRAGGDVHKLTAERIGLYEVLEPDKARYAGKQTNFLVIYGGGAEVLCAQLWRDARMHVDLESAKEWLVNFHETYPEFRACAHKCENVAKQKSVVKYWNGTKRHFDKPWECYKAYNSVVQGGAAQIMKHSMIELDRANYYLVGQVHDSVWIELKEETAEEEAKKIKEIMEWPSEKFGIPFPVDTKVLSH